MEKIEMYVGAGEHLSNMHRLLNEYYEREKEARKLRRISGDFIVYAIFNGIELLHTDSPDEISVKVTGKTVAEQEAAEKAWREEYDRKKAAHKARIPELTEQFRKEARGIIPEDKLELWDKIVPIRLGDLYEGMELREWLKMVKILNQDLPQEERFEEAKSVFDSAGHSGMSAGLVLSGLREFHPDGIAFCNFIKG